MQFADFLRASGLIPGEIIRGRWVRVPTETHPHRRNGSYKLADDGGAGWAQDHATMDAPVTWFPDRSEKLPAVDFAAIAARRNEERRQMIRATQAAREFYLGCKPVRGGHPYLEAHGLDMAGCNGLRVDSLGWLVVPMLKDGNLMSIQRISPTGEKRFWPGASVKGASYPVERPLAGLTVICEGLATGLCVFAALRLCRVVVAFNAGNLSNMARPRGLAVIAADNDHETFGRIGRNPGVKAATESAEILGCGVAVPPVAVGSDWCDWRRERLDDRLANRGKHDREGDIRRAVDAEMAALIQRQAKFTRPMRNCPILNTSNEKDWPRQKREEQTVRTPTHGFR